MQHRKLYCEFTRVSQALHVQKNWHRTCITFNCKSRGEPQSSDSWFLSDDNVRKRNRAVKNDAIQEDHRFRHRRFRQSVSPMWSRQVTTSAWIFICSTHPTDFFINFQTQSGKQSQDGKHHVSAVELTLLILTKRACA